MRDLLHIAMWMLLVCVFVGALSACETTVNVDLPRHPPKLVVNSLVHPDATWEVHLSEARDLWEGEDAIQNVGGARVEILKNDHETETIPYVGQGFYRSALSRPVAGETYTMRVYAEGYETIEASEHFPEPILTIVTSQITNRWQESGRLKLTITWTDPVNVDDYYRLLLYYGNRKGDGSLLLDFLRFQSGDPTIIAEVEGLLQFEIVGRVEGEFLFEDAVFTDILFNGEEHSMTLEIEESFLRKGGTPEDDMVIVQLDHISSSYYQYVKTYRAFCKSRGNPFAEPVLVYSNISNGFGIFAGYSRYSAVIDIE